MSLDSIARDLLEIKIEWVEMCLLQPSGKQNKMHTKRIANLQNSVT